MKRVPQQEILDSEISAEEAERSLRDLHWVNRWFGGVRTTADLLRHALRSRNLHNATVLEVAAGDGYSIARAARRLQSENLQVLPVCLDQRLLRPEARHCEHSVQGDALQLPFAAESFDFVSCALFVHHLAPAQVISFLNGALRVARYAVLVNDLRRSPLHLTSVYASWPLFRSRISWLDGVASVKQAYTPHELRELLEQSQAARVEIWTTFFFRIAAIAWK